MLRRLHPLLRTRRFWTDFLWETEAYPLCKQDAPYPQFQDCKVDLPLTDGFAFSLSLDQYSSYFALDLVAPRHGKITIAWDDQAHWHPHVLRWPELDMICRVLAMQDKELPHPGWVVLLLHRFAPICQGDDLKAIVATLETAWKQGQLPLKRDPRKDFQQEGLVPAADLPLQSDAVLAGMLLQER